MSKVVGKLEMRLFKTCKAYLSNGHNSHIINFTLNWCPQQLSQKMPKHHGGGYLKNLNFFCLESTIALLRLCPNFVKEQAARCCLQLILQLYATTQKRGSCSAARICEQNFDLPMTGSIWGQNTSFCVIFRVYRKGFCPHDCPFLSYKYLRS